MSTYTQSTYGEFVADFFDLWYPDFDPQTISTLLDLAQGGRALELGIGTGRIALPLLQAGIEVHGIDSSQAMIKKMQSKPNGKDIPVLESDFSEFELEGKFDLIYVVFNTFFGLLMQGDQLQCFSNVANHLSPDGVFLIEAFVPDMSRFQDNQTIRMVEIGDDSLRIEVSQINPIEQMVTSKLVHVTETGTRFYPVNLRYAWPSELDLMARFAGLDLRHRWGSWGRTELTHQDRKHISVYGIAS